MDAKKAWKDKKEKSKSSFCLKQLLRKCITKKANERKRKQSRQTPKPTVTDSTQHVDGISVIPMYRSSVSSSGAPPPVQAIVLVDELSSTPSYTTRSSTSSDATNSQCENSITEKRKMQYYVQGPGVTDDVEDIECIELTDEQPTHSSVRHQPQELVFDNVPTLEEKLKMDKMKRKKEKKEETNKIKEDKKAAKIEKRQQIAMEKHMAKISKQQKQKEEREAAKMEKEKKRKEMKLAELNESFEEQESLSDDVKSSKHESQKLRWCAVGISKLEASIVDLKDKIERLEVKNIQRQTQLSGLKEQRSKVTFFERQNPMAILRDYELQFATQGIKKEFDKATREINSLKATITKNQSKIESIKNSSQRVAPIKTVEESNPVEPEVSCHTNGSASSFPCHVIVVKEYCAESSSSLTSLPKLSPNGFLIGVPPSTPCTNS